MTLRIALAVALFAALFFFAPPAEPHLRLCGFYRLTGHPCPLCGLTRGLCALAKGHFADAVRFNALTPLAFVMVFLLFCTGKIAKQITPRIWTAGIAVFAVYGAARIFVTQ